MAKQIYSVKEWEEHFRNYNWGENEKFESMGTEMGTDEKRIPTYKELEKVTVDVFCQPYGSDDVELTYKPFSTIPKTISTYHEYGHTDDGQEIEIYIVASYRRTYDNYMEYKVDNIYTQDNGGNRIQWVSEYKTQVGVGCTSNKIPVKYGDFLYIYLNEDNSHYVYTYQGAQVLNYDGEPWSIELVSFDPKRIPSVDENGNVEYLYRFDKIIDETCDTYCVCDGLEIDCDCDGLAMHCDCDEFTDCDCDDMSGATDCDCDEFTDCDCDDISGVEDENMSW